MLCCYPILQSQEHPLAGTTLTWAEKKVDITSFTTLTIHKVGLEHGGQYKCVVRTLDGRKELADHMFLHGECHIAVTLRAQENLTDFKFERH